MEIEMYVWACPDDGYGQVARVVSRSGNMLYLLLLGTLRHVSVYREHVERIEDPGLRKKLGLDYNYVLVHDYRFDSPWPIAIF